jgi:hypothetical protein
MTIQLENDGAQARWDSTFAARRADESGVNYLRRLSRVGRKYIPRGEQIAQVDFSELPR